MKKVIVLAGDSEQFNSYLEENGLTDSEAVYGWSRESMMGIEASDVVIYGTFWYRNDANKLRDFALSRIR